MNSISSSKIRLSRLGPSKRQKCLRRSLWAEGVSPVDPDARLGKKVRQNIVKGTSNNSILAENESFFVWSSLRKAVNSYYYAPVLRSLPVKKIFYSQLKSN